MKSLHERYYELHDAGVSDREIAAELGFIKHWLPKQPPDTQRMRRRLESSLKMVPVKRLQERYYELREAGVTDKDIAAAAGYFMHYRTEKGPDTQRLLRRLGLRSNAERLQRSVRYDTALHLGAAMGLDPVDLGI